jgi:hypothetical protein
MGTFIIQAYGITSQGNSGGTLLTPSAGTLITCVKVNDDGNHITVRASGAGAGTCFVSFYGDSTNIIVDGVAKSYTALPVSFIAMSAQVDFNFSGVNSAGDSFQVYFDPATISSNFIDAGGDAISQFAFKYPTQPPNILSLVLNGFGFTYTRTAAAGNNPVLEFLQISGTYKLLTHWTVNGVPDTGGYPPTIPLDFNDPITVVPSQGSPLGVTYTPVGLTPTTIPLDPNNPIMPFLPNVDPTQPIIVVGPPFSGSVPVAFVTITIVNGSGIYVIAPGALADTMYINTPVNNNTADVKFPDPFIKTAFLP